MDNQLGAPLLPTGYPAYQAFPQQPYQPVQQGYSVPQPYQVPPSAPQVSAYSYQSAPVQNYQVPQAFSQYQASPPPPQRLGRTSATMLCPVCKVPVQTLVRFENGAATWLCAIGLCVFGCVPCCLYPFCIEALQDAHHFCSRCGIPLGQRRV